MSIPLIYAPFILAAAVGITYLGNSLLAWFVGICEWVWGE